MPNKANGTVIRPTTRYATQPLDLFLIALNIIILSTNSVEAKCPQTFKLKLKNTN
jgi:hypothetical protein